MDVENDKFISAQQYVDTLKAYNTLVDKINKIEKENSYITLSRKIRYIIFEAFMNFIVGILCLNCILGIIFRTNIYEIINWFYMYIRSLL